MKLLAISLTSLLLVACATAPVPELDSRSQQISIGHGNPKDGFVEIGPIEAVHGGSSKLCGFGRRGSFKGVYNVLKNTAANVGADYVHIIKVIEPHSKHNCLVNGYKIDAIAYKRR